MKTILLLIVSYLVFSLSVAAQETTLPDSIITTDHTYQYILTDPQKAQQIMDELKRRKTNKDWELDWCQADLYYNTGKYRLASHYYERVALQNEVKTNQRLYMGLLSTMTECYRMNNDLEKTILTALALIKIAEGLDEVAEMGRAYMFMGIVTYQQKNTTLAEDYFVRAEEYLLKSENAAYLYHFYLTMANLLTESGEYSRAYSYVTNADKYLIGIEAQNPGYTPDEITAYEQGRLYALASELLAKWGKKEQAAMYYNRFKSSPSSSDSRSRIFIVPYLLEIRDYQTAIEISHKRIERLEAETDAVGEDMIAALHHLVTAYQMSGQKERALDYSLKATRMAEEMRKKDRQNTALELATIFDVQQKELLIAQQKNTIERRSILLIASIVIIILSLLTIALAIRSMRRTKRQQLAMLRQIKEMKKYRERLDEMQKETVKGTGDDMANKGTESAAERSTDKRVHTKIDESSGGLSGTRLAKKRSAAEIFELAEKRINDEKLYLIPGITRDRVIELLKVSRTDFIQAMNTYSGSNFTEYINNLRIDHALHLLVNLQDENIEIIAEESGFGSIRSFYRQFKSKYNMSPAEYRRLIKSRSQH